MDYKPNLFAWATSELSQDAFIKWLLEWANYPQSKALHKTAIHLIHKLTDNKIYSIDSVQFYKQVSKINILCIINEEYALLIGDKTDSKNYSKLLEGFIVKSSEDYLTNKIFSVYFNTGNQSNFASVKELGYKLFLRKDLLCILGYGIKQGVNDPIFNDYYDALKNKEASFQSYKLLPVPKWYLNSWKGFYSELQKKLGEGEWDYFPQKKGGSLVFLWYWKTRSVDNKVFDYYLQLEHNKFCFKLTLANREKADEVRDYYRGLLYQKAAEHNVEIYQKGRIGKNMTVAALKNPFIAVDKNGFLDMDSTIKNIRFVEKMMDEI